MKGSIDPFPKGRDPFPRGYQHFKEWAGTPRAPCAT